jgi:hypothetical protein
VLPAPAAASAVPLALPELPADLAKNRYIRRNSRVLTFRAIAIFWSLPLRSAAADGAASAVLVLRFLCAPWRDFPALPNITFGVFEFTVAAQVPSQPTGTSNSPRRIADQEEAACRRGEGAATPRPAR